MASIARFVGKTLAYIKDFDEICEQFALVPFLDLMF
jgi:hypothetical protein